MGISTFSTSIIHQLKNEDYDSQRRYISDTNYTNIVFNTTLENRQYKNVTFKNVTFRHINLNHVEFLNCTIDEGEFINVKSSITYFANSTIKDSRFVDTDLTHHHFINCNLANNTFLSLISECIVDFDYNIYLEDLYANTLAWAGAMFPALLFMGFILETTIRPPLIFSSFGIASLASIGIFFWTNIFLITLIELTVKVMLMCGINALTMVVVEAYPCHVRCTAHGLLRSLFHIASLCAIPIYNLFSHTILLFPAVATVFLLFVAAILSLRIQDNSKVLL